MFLFVYVCFGAAVLAVAMHLALIPRARPAARSLAGGIIGSYPGVFLFQLAGAPEQGSTDFLWVITGWSVGSAVALGTPVFDAFALTWAGRLLRRLWPVRLE